MAAVTNSSNLGAQGKKICHCFHFFPFYWPWSWFIYDLSMILKCWILNQLFDSPLSLSSRGFLVPLYFLHTKAVSSAYLRLLIFLLAILIPACDLSSPVFCMTYSAYKLNKQGNIQPCTPFPILTQSVVPCLLITFSSWPSYWFLRRQVRWSGIPTSLRIFHSLLYSLLLKIQGDLFMSLSIWNAKHDPYRVIILT